MGIPFSKADTHAGAPINQTTYTLTQPNFDNLNSLIQQQATQTAAGNGYYLMAGANCVDRLDEWLTYANVSHDMTSMFTQTLLDTYSTARYWLTTGWGWVYSQIDQNQGGYNYTMCDYIDGWLHDFSEGLKRLFNSDATDEVGDAASELPNTIYSPIAIDLNGDGLNTSSFFSGDVEFDLDGSGSIDRTAWLDPNDAFLAIDLNGDGKINSGAELFGGGSRGEGYAKLGLLDTNQDGLLSSEDDTFNQLLIWQDSNSNGVTDLGELRGLAEAGIDQISAQYESWDQYNNGNLIGEHSWATLNGSTVAVGDIYFMADLRAA